MYGPTPTVANLQHNEQARRRPVPPFDGTDPQPYWNCTRNGVTFKVAAGTYDPYGQYFSIIHGIENQIVEHALRNLTPAGSTVIDVGAAVGSFTIPFLVHGHPVHSFELEPHAFHDLMNHIRLNSDLIKKEHVNCYKFGLWSENKTGDFYDMKNLTFRRLDDVLPESSDVSFVKIDVESAEVEVMKGAAKLLQREEPNMWIECHEVFKQGVMQEVIDYIHELGCFKGFTIKQFELVPGTRHLLVSR